MNFNECINVDFQLQRDLDIEGSPTIDKVGLPKSDDLYGNVEAIVSGFGYNQIKVFKNPQTGKYDEDGSSDGKLRFARANVLTNSECSQLFKSPIYGNHLCAQVTQRDPDILEGICTVRWVDENFSFKMNIQKKNVITDEYSNDKVIIKISKRVNFILCRVIGTAADICLVLVVTHVL